MSDGATRGEWRAAVLAIAVVASSGIALGSAGADEAARRQRDAGAADGPPLGRPAVAEALAPAAEAETPGRGPAQTSTEDREAVQKLHLMNETEIQMGALAKSRGAGRATRVLGAQLVADHRLGERKLASHLRKPSGGAEAPVARSLDADHVLLATRTGAEFDREFALQIIADHNKAIDLVEAAQSATDDDGLRALYGQLLPMLRAHKRAAQVIVAEASRS